MYSCAGVGVPLGLRVSLCVFVWWERMHSQMEYNRQRKQEMENEQKKRGIKEDKTKKGLTRVHAGKVGEGKHIQM